MSKYYNIRIFNEFLPYTIILPEQIQETAKVTRHRLLF
jgi:hypothetical protein